MKKTFNWLHLSACLLGFVAFISQGAFAMPLGTAAHAKIAKFAPSKAEMRLAGVDFTSIVALNNCSGALVRFTTSKDTDKAMVLTNGHCYEGGFLEPGEAITNKNSSRGFTLLNADGGDLGNLRAEKVMYATMTDTDITLYQLTTTYGDIEAKYKVTALTISDKHPAAANPIRIVSGYWKKIYSCDIDAFIYNLKEDNWTFVDSVRYSSPGCETIPGTSGSPIIHAETREVIGINNTGNESGERCTMDNPCEVDEDGTITVNKHAAYGQQTYLIYTCLNDQNQVDTALEGCALPKVTK